MDHVSAAFMHAMVGARRNPHLHSMQPLPQAARAACSRPHTTAAPGARGVAPPRANTQALLGARGNAGAALAPTTAGSTLPLRHQLRGGARPPSHIAGAPGEFISALQCSPPSA